MFYRPMIDGHGLRHNPFKALVSPRPIAWVSTLDSQGRPNLAPYSYFNAVAEAPPIVMIGPGGKKLEEPVEKDTLRNILETREFVVNIVPYALKDAMNTTAAPYAAGVDEYEAAGLEKAACELVAPPRVAASPVALECRFLTRVELPTANPEHSNNAVFGEVVGVHIDPDVIIEGKVDVTRYRPLARLGYMEYAVVNEVFTMPRPTKA